MVRLVALVLELALQLHAVGRERRQPVSEANRSARAREERIALEIGKFTES